MSQVTRLFLVRHGQSEGNYEGRFGGHTATPLTAFGARQAEITAHALIKENITAIYSSDLLRTVQTAEPLARLTKLEIQTTAAFRERNVGVLQGLTFAEAESRHPEHYAALMRRDLEYQFPDGESYRELLARSTVTLDEIIKQNLGGRIAVFSHTGTICFLTLHLLGAIGVEPTVNVWLFTANCGINRIEFRDDVVRVNALNDTKHLNHRQDKKGWS